MEENGENTENLPKINFFKKVWYSIAKIKKYDEMTKQGLYNCIKYVAILLAILSIIMSCIETFAQVKAVNSAISYLDQNLPEIKLNNEQLEIQGDKDYYFYDQQDFVKFFGCSIMIAPKLEQNDAINKFIENISTNQVNVATKNDGTNLLFYKCIIFLKDKYIIIEPKFTYKYLATKLENQDISKEEGITIDTYKNSVPKYLGNTKTEYGKQDIINCIKEKISYSYYIIMNFIVYFVTLILIYVFCLLIVALSYFIALKISKLKVKAKTAFAEVLYAETLGVIVYVSYLIISYITKFKFPYIYAVVLVLTYIYTILLINNKKRKGEK